MPNSYTRPVSAAEIPIADAFGDVRSIEDYFARSSTSMWKRKMSGVSIGLAGSNATVYSNSFSFAGYGSANAIYYADVASATNGVRYQISLDAGTTWHNLAGGTAVANRTIVLANSSILPAPLYRVAVTNAAAAQAASALEITGTTGKLAEASYMRSVAQTSTTLASGESWSSDALSLLGTDGKSGRLFNYYICAPNNSAASGVQLEWQDSGGNWLVYSVVTLTGGTAVIGQIANVCPNDVRVTVVNGTTSQQFQIYMAVE